MKVIARLGLVRAAAVLVLLVSANAQGQVEATNATVAKTTDTSTNLALVKVDTIKYKLGFKAESDFPVGSNRNGFVAVKFTPKMEVRSLSNGTTGTVDVSELTLKRGDSMLTLVKGLPVTWLEHTVDLLDRTDMKTHSLRTGEETTIGGRKMRLRTVDHKKPSCTLVDCVTGEQITVVRADADVQGAATNVVKRLGYLSADVSQHPIVPAPVLGEERQQFRFDVGDKPDPTHQIIVTYPAGQAIPTERDRKVELIGTVSVFSVGGKPMTKGEYSNEVLSLHSWKYVEEKP